MFKDMSSSTGWTNSQTKPTSFQSTSFKPCHAKVCQCVKLKNAIPVMNCFIMYACSQLFVFHA